MKLEEILKEIVEENPVAILVIKENDDYYTSRMYGRISQQTVIDILEDVVEQEREKAFHEVEDQLPF